MHGHWVFFFCGGVSGFVLVVCCWYVHDPSDLPPLLGICYFSLLLTCDTRLFGINKNKVCVFLQNVFFLFAIGMFHVGYSAYDISTC